MSVTWETPPQRKPNRVSWLVEAQQLRSRPGMWARIADRNTKHSARSMVWQIHTGALLAFRPAGDFEASARDGAVWARYLGDGAA